MKLSGSKIINKFLSINFVYNFNKTLLGETGC